MNKKNISTIALVCVLGIAAIIILYLIGFFDSRDNPTQTTDINTITTVSESTPQKTEVSISNADNKIEETAKTEVTEATEPVSTTEYKFRNKNLLNQHFEKHGKDMGFASAEEYEKAASAVVNNPDALHKIEAEDGDDIYYIEATNEFVVVSTDGYLRTYFLPDKGIDYFNKQ